MNNQRVPINEPTTLYFGWKKVLMKGECIESYEFALSDDSDSVLYKIKAGELRVSIKDAKVEIISDSTDGKTFTCANVLIQDNGAYKLTCEILTTRNLFHRASMSINRDMELYTEETWNYPVLTMEEENAELIRLTKIREKELKNIKIQIESFTVDGDLGKFLTGEEPIIESVDSRTGYITFKDEKRKRRKIRKYESQEFRQKKARIDRAIGAYLSFENEEYYLMSADAFERAMQKLKRNILSANKKVKQKEKFDNEINNSMDYLEESREFEEPELKPVRKIDLEEN